MAYFGFMDKHFKDESIRILNNGDFENNQYGDYTYINDIVEGIECLLSTSPTVGDTVPHKVFSNGTTTMRS